MKTHLMIATFGALGVLSRYGIDRITSYLTITTLPISTFIINILGSFALGLIYVLGNEKGLLDSTTYLAISIGFLGGFTTFSSFSIQTLMLFEQRQFILAIGYFLLSPMLGLAATYAGVCIARHII